MTHKSKGSTPAPTTILAPADPLVLAQRVAALALDFKANDVVILDLRGIADVTDCLVIASGTSDAHVRGIANRLLEELGKEKVKPHHVEGLAQGRWVLVDYMDVIVHIFHPQLRDYYQLERLWGDARVVPVDAAEKVG